jgi:uncharacterized phage protein gp47/JayE
MADPRFLTWQEILDQVLSFLPPEWRANFTGKILKRLLVAFALSMEGLYAMIAKVLRLAIIATSEGRWLRALVAGFGMVAYGGLPAVAVVRFERWGSVLTGVSIPAGTAVQADNGLVYTTNAIASLGIGEFAVLVPCTCTTPGVIGNVGPGRINSLRSPILGIDAIANPDAAVGGAEPESDAAVKGRVPKHIAMLHRGTIPATEAAILDQPDLFPEVLAFLTERRANLPGYIRGILSDASGGDLYRPAGWQASEGLAGTWSVAAPQIPYGLIEVGWPCRRFGPVSRLPSGAETWSASASALEVSLGTYRWFYDAAATRLYARAQGEDLNTLNLVVYAGVIWRALQELETKWVAAGVGIDIIVPQVVRVPLALNYALEPGYVAATVEAALLAALAATITAQTMGAPLELEALFLALGGVPGAGGIQITSPTANVVVERGQIIRSAAIAITRRG